MNNFPKKALILAAGVGNRLGEAGLIQPKCLLQFNGKSLLHRHLQALRHCQIEQVGIAVGYRAEAIQAEIERIEGQHWVTTTYNPDYTAGSLLSLWMLREHLSAGEDLLLMDADVLYDPAILQKLARTEVTNCFLLDREWEGGDEPVKLCVSGSSLVEFRKQVSPSLSYDFAGESVGFFRFNGEMAGRLADITQDYVRQGLRETPYEEAIRDLLLGAPNSFGYEDITGLPWIEIDFPQDLQRARREILPRLELD